VGNLKNKMRILMLKKYSVIATEPAEEDIKVQGSPEREVIV
jgi:hypothetical protein